MRLMNQRKGITPVIAIVLLLMVTVGAVGVVYTQFQSLVGDPTEQIDERQRNQDTEISIIRGMSNNTSSPQSGMVVLEVQNTGAVTRNTSEAFRLTTDRPGVVPGNYGNASTDHANSTLIDPDETIKFYTGVQFPQPTNEITFTIDLRGSDKSWSYVCRPETSDAVFC